MKRKKQLNNIIVEDEIRSMIFSAAIKQLSPEQRMQLVKDIMIKTNQPEENTVNFRKQIAEELSRDELIDRLCETRDELQRIKSEWFKFKYNTYEC
jgi:hypothetical protein